MSFNIFNNPTKFALAAYESSRLGSVGNSDPKPLFTFGMVYPITELKELHFILGLQ